MPLCNRHFAPSLFPLAALLLTLGLWFSAIAPASAGTLAWTTQSLSLRDGPGHAYPVTGSIETGRIEGFLALTVNRCSNRWCSISAQGQHGWTSINALNFGRFPTAKTDHVATGPSEICLYEGENYSGKTLCAHAGQVFDDLKLLNLDNRFSSISITGTASAALCRDRGFQSYCQRISHSQPRLDPWLDNNISAIRIY